MHVHARLYSRSPYRTCLLLIVRATLHCLYLLSSISLHVYFARSTGLHFLSGTSEQRIIAEWVVTSETARVAQLPTTRAMAFFHANLTPSARRGHENALMQLCKKRDRFSQSAPRLSAKSYAIAKIIYTYCKPSKYLSIFIKRAFVAIFSLGFEYLHIIETFIFNFSRNA